MLVNQKYPPHYFRWRAMRYRCSSPNSQEWKRYGARGIKVCPEWHDFKTFQKWALKTFEKGKSIDRIDNNGPYSPENCRWATPLEQQLNARRRTPDRLAGLEKARIGLKNWQKERWGDPKTRKSKNCTVCKKHLNVDSFCKSRNRADGLQSACRKCQHAYYKN